jgi:hypothetical protein
LSLSTSRRFKDFADLNSQVKQNFKGHHLRSSLPLLPEKLLKITTDHRDPSFIQDRRSKLDMFIREMVAIPHVVDMSCLKAFLGLIDQIREVSFDFHLPKLGLTLAANVKNVAVSPAVVQSIQTPEYCDGIGIGDCVSRINGVSVNGLNFTGVVNRIKMLPKPMIIHFVQIIGAPIETRVADSSSPVDQNQQQSRAFPHMGGAAVSNVMSPGAATAPRPLPTFDRE